MTDSFGVLLFIAAVIISCCTYGIGREHGTKQITKEQPTVYIPVSLETDAECMLKVMEVGDVSKP